LISNACSFSSNARTERNNLEAHNKHAAKVFLVDEFETTQEKKSDGTSKEEEYDVAASRRNRRKGKKNVTFSLRFHFMQKIFFRVSKCIIFHFLLHFQVEASPSHTL
jgi:hypothetical protein